LAVLAVYVLAGFVGPLIVSFDPQAVDLTGRLVPPFGRTTTGQLAVAGTDQLGRQILPQLIYGARVSLIVGCLVLGIAATFGLIVGTLSGYLGGVTDAVIMRIADIQLSVPGIVLAILMIAVLGPGVTNIVVTLAFAQWPIFARLVRGIALALREQDFVIATRLMGASRFAVVRKSILPECVPSVAVLATANLGHVVVAEAALSFLGLGLPANTVSWGSMISDGRAYLPDTWWISTLPGIALVILVLCASVLGDAIGELDQPALRRRWPTRVAPGSPAVPADARASVAAITDPEVTTAGRLT
jgi:peptide/nickel transport system permease protein